MDRIVSSASIQFQRQVRRYCVCHVRRQHDAYGLLWSLLLTRSTLSRSSTLVWSNFWSLVGLQADLARFWSGGRFGPSVALTWSGPPLPDPPPPCLSSAGSPSRGPPPPLLRRTSPRWTAQNFALFPTHDCESFGLNIHKVWKANCHHKTSWHLDLRQGTCRPLPAWVQLNLRLIFSVDPLTLSRHHSSIISWLSLPLNDHAFRVGHGNTHECRWLSLNCKSVGHYNRHIDFLMRIWNRFLFFVSFLISRSQQEWDEETIVTVAPKNTNVHCSKIMMWISKISIKSVIHTCRRHVILDFTLRVIVVLSWNWW